MCVTCGCGKSDSHSMIKMPAARGAHDHGHGHDHAHDARPANIVKLERRVLEKNDRIAGDNRGWLAERGLLALNLVSSPGAGKTTLLTRTIADWQGLVCVVEGDQATANDAERIRAAGARAVQINTGTGCHLEADQVQRALAELAPEPGTLVMIENVGNLVCPALFDLGEDKKVVILSVTEGDDKPLKYPHMFRASALMIITKTDLAPYVSFDIGAAIAHARSVRPDIEVLTLSATTGVGLDAWYAWLRARQAAVATRATHEARSPVMTP